MSDTDRKAPVVLILNKRQQASLGALIGRLLAEREAALAEEHEPPAAPQISSNEREGDEPHG